MSLLRLKVFTWSRLDIEQAWNVWVRLRR